MTAKVAVPLEVYPWDHLNGCAREFSDSIRITKAQGHRAEIEAEDKQILAIFLNLALEAAARESGL